MKLSTKLKTIYIKIDDFREEKIEDYIAKGLAALDRSGSLDKLETKLIILGITTANAYAASYGLPQCPEDFKEKIAKYIVQENSKINKALQKQLQKKSKMYRKRHQND